MRLIFILDGLKYGNAYIRGILPTIGLRDSGLDVEYIVSSNFDPNTVGKGDTVVFVKYDRLGQSKAVKESGANVVLDVVDSKKHWKQHRDYLDALIVNTRSQSEIIKNRDNFTGPILKIPHILTNFTKDRKSQRRKQLPEKIKTIGYLGVPETFTDFSLFKEYCASKDIRWYNDQPSIDTNESSTLNLDLGCINFTGDKDRIGGTISISKPSAKLLNLFSYGIPAIFSPYESYLDEIGKSGYDNLLWGCCNTPSAMFDKIQILMDNRGLYQELSDASFEMSKRFHISNSLKIYDPLIQLAGC